MKKNKVIKHLQGDIKTFKKEAAEDRELISKLKKGKSKSPTLRRETTLAETLKGFHKGKK